MYLPILLFAIFLKEGMGASDRYCPKEPYNKYERPYAGGPAVNVTTRLYVRNLNTIDESKFSYAIDYIIYYWYNDPRLSINCSTTDFLKTVRTPRDIWFPNLGLINCHLSQDVENSEKIRVSPNGDVSADKRITSECYCIMDLTAFPLDTQRCPFRLESYLYSRSDMSLHWHKETPVSFEEGLQLVGYMQGHSTTEKVSMEYSYGTWEVMEVTFVFKRQALHFIFRAYIPVILLMIFNFASYWIPHSAIPARVTLIITTFLTITFILQSISAQTAKATTTTSLQIFLIFSVVLVVVAILEFLVVLYFGEKEKEEIQKIHAGPAYPLTDLAQQRSSVSEKGEPLKSSNRVEAEENVLTKKKYNVAVIDKVFRYLVPITYAIFCIIYFVYFTNYDTDK